MADHGLSQRQMETVKRILATSADSITHVDLFGSRVTGRHRPQSDIDLVLHGDVTEADIDRLWTLFHDSNLPVSVDVASYRHTTYAPLRSHMDRVGKRLFTGDQLRALAEMTGAAEND